jgi:dTMP kinase
VAARTGGGPRHPLAEDGQVVRDGGGTEGHLQHLSKRVAPCRAPGERVDSAVMPRGMLIALEGIDGAGKHTQIELLVKALTGRGIPCETVTFPVYNSFFGRLIERYLNGEFGALAQVDPHFSSLLFAGDRLRQREQIVEMLKSGKTVLADRYIASNLAHQGARVPTAERQEFLDWLRRLEYEAYELPREDLVLYLRIDPDEAQQRLQARAEREERNGQGDLHEADVEHLANAARLYDHLARAENWITVDCIEPATGERRTPEEVHRLVMAAVEVRLARFRAMQALAQAAPEGPKE